MKDPLDEVSELEKALTAPTKKEALDSFINKLLKDQSPKMRRMLENNPSFQTSKKNE